MELRSANRKLLVDQEQLNAEDFLALTSDLISLFVLVYRVEGKKLQFNATQLFQTLGHNYYDSFLTIEDLIHPEDVSTFRNFLSHLSGSTELLRQHCRFLRGDGTYCTYELKGDLKGATSEAVILGTPVVVCSGLEDGNHLIAEQELPAEAVLRFGRFDYELLSGNTSYTKGFCYLLDAQPDAFSVEYSDFLSRLTAVEESGHGSRDARSNRGVTAYEEEYDLLTQKQRTKRIRIFGTRWFDKEGKLCRDAGIAYEVTEQRKQEDKLSKLILELQLSNKDLEEFAYVASHDLQEPLRKISTFSSRLGDRFARQLTEEGMMYLERIRTSADSMRSLIDSLLEFSVISRVRQSMTTVNLNIALHQVKKELELKIEETGTVITFSGLPVVEASMSQVKQLFSNLIGNAIKFHKPGTSPVIQIGSSVLSSLERVAYKLPAGTIYHKISVTDNGIGFADNYALSIFQIFQRLHGKVEYPGSGIGLAICKRIVEKHQGLIFAENIPEKGACFTFVLPEKQNF